MPAIRAKSYYTKMSNYWRGKEILLDFSNMPKRKGLKHFRRDLLRELSMIGRQLCGLFSNRENISRIHVVCGEHCKWHDGENIANRVHSLPMVDKKEHHSRQKKSESNESSGSEGSDGTEGSDAETVSECGPSKKSIDSDMIYQTEFMDMMMIQEAICVDHETGMDEGNLGGLDATNSEGAATVTLDDFDYGNE